jgi:hypothetical protein
MLWYIRGTDADHDLPVELLIHAADAPSAIQTAMRRGIVVSHIRRQGIIRYKSLILLVLCAVLGAGCWWTYAQNGDLRQKLDQTLVEQNRMADSVAAAERTVANLKASGTLEKNSATQLAGELAAARSRMSLSEQQLASSQQRMTDLENAAKLAGELDIEVRTLKPKLQAATEEVGRLRTETAMQARRIEELQTPPKPLPDKSLERVAELEKTLAEMRQTAAAELEKAAAELQKERAAQEEESKAQAVEIEKLKKELLALVKEGTAPVLTMTGMGGTGEEAGGHGGAVAGEEQGGAKGAPGAAQGSARGTLGEPKGSAGGAQGETFGGEAPAVGNRRFLDVNFDKAHDFVVLHTDPDSLAVTNATVPAGSDLVFSGAAASHAVRLKMEHDRAKAKVFGATLEVSLAADAPKEVLAENKVLMGEFVRVFAGDVKVPEEVAAGAAKLATSDATRQMVFLGEASKVTLWNGGGGVYVVRVEAKKNDQ